MSLHDAARTGDEASLLALIEKAAEANALEESVRAVDKLKRTPLHLASWAGHASVVRALLEAGADVHAAAMDGIQSVHFAAQNGHAEVLKELLKRGAKVNVRDFKKQHTPLHYAASKGHAACCEYLLRKNADRRARNKQKKIPAELVPASDDVLRDALQPPAKGDAPQAGSGAADTSAVPASSSPSEGAKGDEAAPTEAAEAATSTAAVASAADGSTEPCAHPKRASESETEEGGDAKRPKPAPTGPLSFGADEPE